MNKKISSFLISLLLLILGISIIFFPAFMQYFNKDAFLFDFALFLEDYPSFRFIVGVLFVIFAIFDIIFVFNKKTDAIVHTVVDSSYGNKNLHFTGFEKYFKSEKHFDSVLSNNFNSDSLKKLEKESIKAFYSNTVWNKKISFLGIATIPSLVYAGYQLGESSIKVDYYHWNRDKGKSVRLHNGLKTIKMNHEIIGDEKSKNYIIYVCTSFKPENDLILKQFDNCNIIICKSDTFGVDVIKSRKDLKSVSVFVRETIASITDFEGPVGLILQCSSELCFGIGQKLKSQGLPKIRVYNFDKKNAKNPWNWSIDLD